jgi:curved DNA-binding protein CbpA
MQSGKRKWCGRLRVAAEDSVSPNDTTEDDYYAVLGLLPDATPEEIKKAYYDCMKSCHPDLSGNDPETTNFCMFINEVYAVLSDPIQRKVYDEIHGYSLTSINPFMDDSSPKDHVFVDEFTCIGCKNCANVACDVFAIEEDFGRARVFNQRGNPELVQQAIDSCPVDCIHWTSAAQLSLLEDEMRRIERVNVALMLSGMGSASFNVFRMASSRWEKRQSKVLEQEKFRMMRQESSGKTDSFWNNLWGSSILPIIPVRRGTNAATGVRTGNCSRRRRSLRGWRGRISGSCRSAIEFRRCRPNMKGTTPSSSHI